MKSPRIAVENSPKKLAPTKIIQAAVQPVSKLLRVSCSKCGKELAIDNAFCCFKPELKFKNGEYREVLFSVFLCSECSKTVEKNNEKPTLN
jgi:hypothetical protein